MALFVVLLAAYQYRNAGLSILWMLDAGTPSLISRANPHIDPWLSQDNHGLLVCPFRVRMIILTQGVKIIHYPSTPSLLAIVCSSKHEIFCAGIAMHGALDVDTRNFLGR